MHIIYDIKNKIASELAGFGFWQLKLTARPVELRKIISQTFGPVGDSSAEELVWNLTVPNQFLYDYYIFSLLSVRRRIW